MTDEAKTAPDWCKTEAHARHMLKVLRSALVTNRTARVVAELRCADTTNSINDVKLLMHAKGWKE